MNYSEKWGDTVDIAVDLALIDLKLTRDQVNIIVLEEPSKGFLGFGSKLAKVRVEEKASEKKVEKPVEKAKVTEKPVQAALVELSKKQKNKPTKKKKKKTERVATAEKVNQENSEITLDTKIEPITVKPNDLVEQEAHPAKEFLESVIKEMGLEATVKVSTNADSVYVDIEGKDTGTIIGKRGQTLDSIQYLTSLVVNKGDNEYLRVVVDAEGYRAKREATLEKLAIRLAEKAIKSGKNVRLEPMNPYERKVIHATLQGLTQVTTKSEGEEPFRRVIILPARH